jgi:hypothetical protein
MMRVQDALALSVNPSSIRWGGPDLLMGFQSRVKKRVNKAFFRSKASLVDDFIRINFKTCGG